MLLEPIFEQTFWTALSVPNGSQCAPSVTGASHRDSGAARVLGVEVDIRKYFDSIPIAQLREFLNQRVTDGVVRRMIDKWLKAACWSRGRCSTRDRTPQGESFPRAF